MTLLPARNGRYFFALFFALKEGNKIFHKYKNKLFQNALFYGIIEGNQYTLSRVVWQEEICPKI